MKIALLNDKLDAGGAEKVLVNMANMLQNKGIAVTVILFLNESVLDSIIHPSIPVIYLRRKGRFDLKAMFMLKRKLKEFDIAHIHSRYNLLYYTVVKIVTHITKTKTVFHEHVPSFKISFF